jgi:multicomponent Na+:H+ antiporter subunit F
VTAWLLAGAALLALLVPCALAALRGSPINRLLGLELASATTTLAMVALAEGFGRAIYFDLALVFAVVSFGATLFFVRFVERWV